MPVCDGCGATVDDPHIRRRIEHLEMATRCRPIHIQVLILDSAPPTPPEDYFYRVSDAQANRSAQARGYFDALIQCSGEAPSRFAREADALAEFQRQGLFLANVVDCPCELDREKATARCAPSLLKRIQFSYKPKYLALISPALASIIPLLTEGGWAEQLILNNGAPFDFGLGDGGHGKVEFAKRVNEKLVKIASNSA